MASLLRQIVAGPRARHPEAGLDLCYVTDEIIVTSGPSSTYPQRAYRNPTDALVKFLDYKHGENWAIWEFRAEGTGYPDSEVYGRVRHYPWPDHHPPPFALIPNIMASMRNHLKEEKVTAGKNSDPRNVVVVHCKAGKGRSGTVACSYLISEEGWKVEEALARFTERRMRQGFGNGVSIPSQLRWVGYVDLWSKTGKTYVERPVEIIEVHAWGLRDGVKVSVEGFIEEGRKIKVFHTFSKDERIIVDSSAPNESPIAGAAGFNNDRLAPSSAQRANTVSDASLIDDSSASTPMEKPERQGTEQGGKAVIFRPKTQIMLPSSDACIDVERRNRAKYGWTMVTAVAHVWFNVFFESSSKETKAAHESDANLSAQQSDRGVFEIDWDAMDGLKGSSRKGTRAMDKLAVIWRAIGDDKGGQAKPIPEPAPGEAVPESQPADWAGKDSKDVDPKKNLGLRVDSPASAEVSRASSVRSEGGGRGNNNGDKSDYEESLHEVKANIDAKNGKQQGVEG